MDLRCAIKVGILFDRIVRRIDPNHSMIASGSFDVHRVTENIERSLFRFVIDSANIVTDESDGG